MSDTTNTTTNTNTQFKPISEMSDNDILAELNNDSIPPARRWGLQRAINARATSGV